MRDRLTLILEHQRDLQSRAFGGDPGTYEGEEFIEYFRLNALALIIEVGEALQKMRWKFYGPQAAPGQEGRRRPEGELREEVVEELVDVLHFLLNLLLALRVDSYELMEAYLGKAEINRARQESVRMQYEVPLDGLPDLDDLRGDLDRIHEAEIEARAPDYGTPEDGFR